MSAEKIALDEERPQLTLPVAKALATLMGGDLSITHDRERMTPHFSLHIILEEDPAHSPEPQADLPRKLSAFIFDNSASLVLGLSAQLKRWGLDVKHPHTEADLEEDPAHLSLRRTSLASSVPSFLTIAHRSCWACLHSSRDGGLTSSIPILKPN
ncbi:hypothetical protein LWC08_02435 [Desulfobaculum bizertense]|uniref:hypothetical protein n=1 Tax=Desulfobaculum bizertense TaxID=376490 RepID=UPI001F2EE539|nr:hypothetical protein [Desulfobaculum bizertense]UIJ38442.1 hypothetical protein LWC08_02435 [Desulfobaculum bizertense]